MWVQTLEGGLVDPNIRDSYVLSKYPPGGDRGALPEEGSLGDLGFSWSTRGSPYGTGWGLTP